MTNLRKKGVSLIAVLLFMLVATIAATATFKWLSSSNGSSGSRMMQQEAYQSAIAGLENARTWMTYHANDVGSLIKQYKEGANGTIKPIKLNSRLRELTRSGQNYDVWLVGVNTEQPTYKLKLLSTGIARNGSVYSEVGIFNVDGLYQVKKPQQNEESSGHIDFNYSYFGGSYHGAGNVTVTSAMVNGDWSGNPQNIDSNLVITGRMSLSGSDVTIKDGCVGGDYSIENNGLTADNMYFAGSSRKFGNNFSISETHGRVSIHTTGNLYVEGDIDVNKEFTVGGSMTLMGKFNMHASDMSGHVSITKDLCLGESAEIDFTNNGNKHKFTAGRHVWVPGTAALKNGNSNCDNLPCNILGDSANALLYINGATTSGTSYLQPNTAGYFSTNGTIYSSSPTFDKPKCAQDIKDWCNSVWTKESHCGANYKIDDPIVVAYDAFDDYAKYCDVSSWDSKDFVTAANKCYTNNNADVETAKTNLYNGYQVIHITGTAPGNDACQASGLSFKGKFIIIIDDKISCQNGVADVEDGSYVFLYLKNGASYFQQKAKNYFVYSLKEIEHAQSLNLNGTIYTPSDSCAGIKDIQSSTMRTNKQLLKDLGDAHVLCNNDGTPCGTNSVVSEGSGGIEYSGSILYIRNDDYYIANAAQLSVTIESQYKAMETPPSVAGSKEVEQDFIVLPRVIYMSANPYGTLADYYNVLGLNGAIIEKDEDKVSCPALSSKTKGLLYDRTSSSAELISQGIYTCSYTEQVNGAEKSVPFYIVVTGKNGNAPFVRFTEANVQMASSSNYTVKASIPAHDAKFDLKVIKPGAMDNWNITVQNGSCTENTCTFEIPANTDATEVSLFAVTTTNAGNGTAMFQISSGEGYAIASPSTEVLYIASSVTVDRNEVSQDVLKKFCEGDNSSCPGDVSAWPECTTDAEWVIASGANCGVGTMNTEWSCGVTSDISLSLTEAVPEGCVAITPEENVIKQSELVVGNTYYLAASLKAKPGIFKFGFSGNDAGLMGETIIAKITSSTESGREGIEKSCTYGTDVTTTVSTSGSDDVGFCELEVFRGETVTLSFPDNHRPSNFNYWKCLGTNCPSTMPSSGNTFTLPNITYEGNKVIAYFDETDKHCFFDEFKLSSPSCGEGTSNYCFSTSLSGTKKWHVGSEADLSKIDYENGYVAAKMNKSDKSGVTVMSTAIAGLSGTMKAQFQVPRITTDVASIPETVKKSGIILRSSTETGLDYLLLSVYANTDGILTATLCNKAGTSCATKIFEGAHISSRNSVVTLTTLISQETISLVAYIGSFDLTEYTTSFSYADDGFSTYSNSGEYVGFRLTDPNFKLFDIGWKSDDYGSECWDTYPTVDCSFRAAYDGGIVPINETATPWVGLSSWFDANGCTPLYYYNGTDACGGSGSDYVICSGGYKFTESGIHGYAVSGGSEIKTAKAGVTGCANLDADYEDDLAKTALGHCGTFWVGEMAECRNGIKYANTGYHNTDALYTSSNDTENLRLSTLKIELENSDHATVEVYLLSTLDGKSIVESKSFETTADGIAVVDVSAISDADGFNPEKVSGVAIKTATGSYVNIKDVYTICPNEVSLTCGSLAYNASSFKWEFSVDITNYTKVAEIEVWKLLGDADPMGEAATASCLKNTSDGGNCYPLPKTDGKSALYKSFADHPSFSIEDHPYANPNTYKIAAKLTTVDGEEFDCETESVTIEAISRECSIDKPKAKQSAGIPQFHYDVSNCPTAGCSYKVTLMTDAGVKIGDDDIVNVTNTPTDGTGTSSGTTSGLEANRISPLDVGTYKFRLESTDENLPFNPCEQTFEVEQGVPATGTCSIDENTLSISVTGANNVDDIPVTIIYNDNIGNVIGTYTVDIDESLTDDINLKNVLTAGTYTIAMVINGTNVTCGSYERIADLSLSCPNTELVAPTATFAPTVMTGCEKGDCSWSISDGTTSNAATVSYSSGNISIANANPGTRYTITVTRGSDDDPKTCTVNFKSESNINATCTFDKSDYEWYESLSKVKITNPNSKDYNGMAYRFTWKAPGATAESQLASGNLGTGDNSIREISTSHLAQPGSYYVYLDGGSKPACTMTLASGSGLPTMRATSCKASSTSIPTSGTTKISATLTKCNGTSNCTWYIKKNGGSTPVKSGSYGDKVDQAEVSGPGTYTIHLLSADADASCTVEVTKASPASGCKLSDASRNYGDGVQFQAKVTATSGTTYEIIDPNGNTVVSNSFTQTYNNQDWNYSFHAKVSGSYTLKIGGEEACSNASMTVSPAYLNNCKFDPTSVPEGNSSTFKFKINNCKNNECSFSLKKDGYVVSGDAYTKTNQPEGDYSLSSLTEAGNYVLWLNGEETDCAATLTVTAGGTLSCSFPSEAFAGDEGKIHVVSSRASGKYDAYIDGAIARDPWNNAKENFDINENGTVDVSFKIPSVGTHTWKITPHGSSTSLCDGSFNSSSDVKADCWFIYNNGGDTVSGTVAPETQLQFCIGPANAHKEVSISGKKKGANLSQNQWTETSQKACVYFEAPSSSGSYPFSATYNSNEVCNTSQTLVVQAPPSVTSCSVSATSLTSTETATFSASVANVTSWSLKQDGTEIKYGGSTTSISATITGFGEYKLYLNGETTAKCTKTISEKTAGGEVTSIGTLTSFDQRITAKNGECFKININSGSNGKLRCGHGWQNGSCSIKVTYGGNSTTMTDSYCNNDNGNPLSIGVMNSLDPDAVACVEITGASDTQCRVTNW